MDADTYTITGGPLKPHEYITIKRMMTAGDEAWIQNHMITVSGDRRKPTVEATYGETRLATLKRMIVGWRLTKTVLTLDGQRRQVEIELSGQAIENLPVKISNFIHEAINKLDEEDEEGESDEDFLPDADGHSESAESSLAPMKTIHRRA